MQITSSIFYHVDADLQSYEAKLPFTLQFSYYVQLTQCLMAQTQGVADLLVRLPPNHLFASADILSYVQLTQRSITQTQGAHLQLGSWPICSGCVAYSGVLYASA